jgi:hypothetical protein
MSDTHHVGTTRTDEFATVDLPGEEPESQTEELLMYVLIKVLQ